MVLLLVWCVWIVSVCCGCHDDLFCLWFCRSRRALVLVLIVSLYIVLIMFPEFAIVDVLAYVFALAKR